MIMSNIKKFNELLWFARKLILWYTNSNVYNGFQKVQGKPRKCFVY